MKLISLRLLVVTALLLFAVALGIARNSERILDFHSDITVKEDSSMIVTETVKVVAAGIDIRHGIYRDFPTRYKDNLGNRYVVGFDVLEVMLDGSTSPYHTKNMSNGVRIYIGDPDSNVSSGVHTYTLRYKTNRQLGFFKDHDELYWNVTGNGWVFPIERATATVTLPTEVPRDKTRVEGYTGPKGSKEQNYQASVDKSGRASFRTTRGLGPYEGLTIVVSFPKGFVTEPSARTKAGYLLNDNKALLVGLIGLLLVTGYFLIVWWNYGRDIPAGTIIPRFSPPEGYSPAALRYVRRMGYDNKTFAAALISMAVKGYINIKEAKEGLLSGKAYTLKKVREIEHDPRSVIEVELRRGVATRYSILAGQAGVPVETVKSIVQAMSSEGLPVEVSDDMVRMYAPSASSRTGSTPENSLANEEQALLANLLPLPGDSIALKNTNYQDIQQAIAVFTTALKAGYQNRFFVTNTALYAPGVVISILFLLLLGYLGIRQTGSEESARFFGGLMFTMMPLLFFFLVAFPLWRNVFSSAGTRRFVSLFAAIFITGFLSIFIFVAVFLIGGVPISLILIAVCLIIVNVVFYHLLKAPTPSGRKLMDETEGFRMYLDTAEKDEMNFSNPPEKTPELFEKYLPYALALDVEQRWSEKFAGVLARAATGGESYHPSWYHGASWSSLGAAGFASSLSSSLSSAISSSATAPGSSSGSGGGGSSGGGGGGGGGGGW